jgi:hypothetical protein
MRVTFLDDDNTATTNTFYIVVVLHSYAGTSSSATAETVPGYQYYSPTGSTITPEYSTRTGDWRLEYSSTKYSEYVAHSKLPHRGGVLRGTDSTQ